jgi:hypothetical protein
MLLKQHALHRVIRRSCRPLDGIQQVTLCCRITFRDTDFTTIVSRPSGECDRVDECRSDVARVRRRTVEARSHRRRRLVRCALVTSQYPALPAFPQTLSDHAWCCGLLGFCDNLCVCFVFALVGICFRFVCSVERRCAVDDVRLHRVRLTIVLRFCLFRFADRRLPFRAKTEVRLLSFIYSLSPHSKIDS